MVRKLLAVANATSNDAVLTNTESQADTTDLKARSFSGTGGQDDDYILIPNCSGREYFADHHITIKADGWTVALWTDDHDDYKLHWNKSASYEGGSSIDGTEEFDRGGILILTEGGEISVRCGRAP